MVKLSGPLLSESAHGSIAKTLTFSRRRSGQQARRYNKPTRPASPAQRGQRRLTEFLVAQWQNMTAPQKAAWESNARTSGKNLSGYHYFLREAQRNLYLHHGLCAYLHCNEIVNGTVLDLSGKGNHGSLGPSFPSDAPTLKPSRSARFDKALSYNGSTQYINLGNDKTLEFEEALTIDVWFYANTLTPSDYYFTLLSKGGNYNLNIRNGLLRYEGFDKNSNYFAFGFSYIELNKWYNAVFTYDKSLGSANAKAFINGKFMNSVTETDGLKTTVERLWIGGYYALDRFFTGMIDEASLYKRAFSAAEIKTRYDLATQKI